MRDLNRTHKWLHEQFLAGNCVARHSDRLWAGLSLDLVIEQTMMRSIKAAGGLTHGRGMAESVRVTWLSTLPECSSIHSALTQITRTERNTSELVEASASRIKRDSADLSKLKQFLTVYSPFRFTDNARLISQTSGVVADVKDAVNCDKAFEIGCHIQQSWDNQCLTSVKLKKLNVSSRYSIYVHLGMTTASRLPLIQPLCSIG